MNKKENDFKISIYIKMKQYTNKLRLEIKY